MFGGCPMSIKSEGSTVTVSISLQEEHTTFLRGSSSSVNVSVISPYLSSFVEVGYRCHPSARAWAWRRTDGFTRSLPIETRQMTRTDGKVYTSVPITVKTDSKVVTTETFSTTNVDGQVPFGGEEKKLVDAKVAFAVKEMTVNVDGKIPLSDGIVETNADSKVVLSGEEVSLDADARAVMVHITDTHWVNDFLRQIFPQLRSSSQVWFLPTRIPPFDRKIITLPPLSCKYVVIFRTGVIVHEYVGNRWNYVGSSGDELPSVISLNSAARMVRLINPTDKEAFVIVLAYEP